MNNSVTILIISFYGTNLGIFLLTVFGVSMFLDAPNAEFPPIVMLQLYPPLIGF